MWTARPCKGCKNLNLTYNRENYGKGGSTAYNNSYNTLTSKYETKVNKLH